MYYKVFNVYYCHVHLIHCFLLVLQDLSDYSRVNPLTVTPPWCLTLCLSGHAVNKDFGTLISEYVHTLCFSDYILGMEQQKNGCLMR